MKSIELKVTRIGNSRGVRLPAETLRRFEIGESVIMEETLEGILLRPNRAAVRKLSWNETAEQIAVLRRLGCRMGQGYFFSAGVPASQVGQLLEADRPYPLSAAVST